MVEGKHTVLVIAKRKGFSGTRRFDFEVAPDNAAAELEVQLEELPDLVNRSVLVMITVSRSGSRDTPTGIRLMCSVGGRRFVPCELAWCV